MAISEKYIKCAKCSCKCINDEEHIKLGLGYKQLETPYRTCLTCRDKANTCVIQRLKIYLVEEKPQDFFIIKYRINDKDKKITVRYKAIGCEEGLDKANNRITELEEDLN